MDFIKQDKKSMSFKTTATLTNELSIFISWVNIHEQMFLLVGMIWHINVLFLIKKFIKGIGVREIFVDDNHMVTDLARITKTLSLNVWKEYDI